MASKKRAIKVGNGDPAVVVPTGVVDMLDDRCPDAAFSRIVWPTQLSAYSKHCADGRPDGSLVAADDDDSWSAVTRDVGT
jgi:hypothetical protein